MKSAALRRLRGIYSLADDTPRRRHNPRAVIQAVLAGGSTVVQLHLKHTADRDALALAHWAVELTRSAGALLFVNDRFDLADLAGADGVHLGQHDLAPERIPEELRERLLIGLSTHTLDQVRESQERPVDYIGFGPIFGTTSKESAWQPRGTGMLARAVELAGRPVVAIGGIDLENVALVARTGAAAAAIISAIADAVDPAAATRALQEQFA